METPISNTDVEEVTSFSTVSKGLGRTLLAVIVLAVDELNPVKVLCSYTGDVFLRLREGHVAALAAFLLCCLVLQQRRHVLYHLCRLFFRCTFNNLFFRSVEIIGAENLPARGPVILTGNHNNQFVDGVFLLANSHREISFMIAQKSWDRPIVGFLARAFNCIPVSRPQDLAFRGAGQVVADGSNVVCGKGTLFAKEVSPGCQLEIAGHAAPYKVVVVKSDSELELDSAVEAKEEGGEQYKVLPKVDQTKMYGSVYGALKEGRCLGIFPEGGSHDQTDLLPLKAGVAIIALDAYSKHSIQVPIVPVGLNYFKGHQFGGRVVMEFGPPIHIPQSIYAQAEQDKKAATDALLQTIFVGMRSTIVPTPNYSLLQKIYMVRRLYTWDGVRLSTSKAMDLNRRFAVGISRFMDLASTDSDTDEEKKGLADASEQRQKTDDEGDADAGEQEGQIRLEPEEKQEFLEINRDLEKYMADLKALGLRDHQVRQVGWWSFKDLASQLVWLLVTVGLGAIPNALINLPAMAISSRLAVIEQKKALKASKVKVAARDVVMSYKIIYVLAMIPIIFVFYGSLLFLLTPWTTRTIAWLLICLPLGGFLGMLAAEQGVRTYADLVPIYRRLRTKEAWKYEQLQTQRSALQRRLFNGVKKLGPRLGDLYYAKDVDWSKEMSPRASTRRGSDPKSIMRCASMNIPGDQEGRGRAMRRSSTMPGM